MHHHWLFAAAASASLAANAQPPPGAAPPLSDIRIDVPEAETAGRAQAGASAPAAVPALSVSPQDLPALTAAVERGRLLFELARAGQVTTQDMLARIPDPGAAGIAGWIAVPGADGTVVTYYADGADGPVAVYRGRVVAGRVESQEVFAAGARPPLGAVERRMAAARSIVAGLEREACPAAAAFNDIVIPPATARGAIDVYKLSAQTRRGAYPVGGHYRATVAADGSVGGARAFNGRCVELETPADAAGQPPRPLTVTHLLDPLPTEIHVFLSLWMNRPLLVATGEDRAWVVARGRVGRVPPAAPQAQAPPPPGPGR
jgi:hypothetical protein